MLILHMLTQNFVEVLMNTILLIECVIILLLVVGLKPSPLLATTSTAVGTFLGMFALVSALTA